MNDFSKFTNPNLQKPQKLMAAKGLLPLDLKGKLKVWTELFLDQDKEVAMESAKQISRLNPEIFKDALDLIMPVSIKLILFLWSKAEILKVLCPAIDDPAILSKLASHKDLSLSTMIASREKLIIENPEILKVLLERKDLDNDLENRLATIYQQYEEEITLKLGDFSDIAEDPEILKESDDILFDETSPISQPKEEDAKKENIMRKVNQMTIPQKIKLARNGNSFVRKMLINSPIKAISGAVLENEKITGDEILKIANNKSTSVDLISKILLNREWMKNYQIKLAVVKNPKTPIRSGMNLLKTVVVNDLKLLTKDRTVPPYIAQEAKKQLARKTTRG